jgi:DNA-binding XRE family transcriptional regulator
MSNVVRFPRRRHGRTPATSASLRAAKFAKTSNDTAAEPRSVANRTTPGQWGLGMPLDRQPLTVLSDCASALARSPVPPHASIIVAQVKSESSMGTDIVRDLRTRQGFATCETTNPPNSRTIRSMDTDLEVSNRLAALREKLGLDQAQFAKSLGIEKNTYNAYERGKRPLTIETAKKIRRRYGISVDWLLFGDIGQPNQVFLVGIEPQPEAAKKAPARKKRSVA